MNKAKIIQFRFRRRVGRPGPAVGSWTSDEWLQFDRQSIVIDGEEYIELDVLRARTLDDHGRKAPTRKICSITATREEFEEALASIKPGRRVSTDKKRC